jgi:hypothetical protein
MWCQLPVRAVQLRKSHLDANLLVDCGLLVLDLLLKLPELRAVGSSAIRLQYLNVPVAGLVPTIPDSVYMLTHR